MATQFIFKNTQTHGITLTSPSVTNLYDLGRTFGASLDTCITNTTSGGSGIPMTKTAAGASVGWITEPFPQAVTITTGTANLWFEESDMNANAQVGIQFYRWVSGTTATVIGGGIIPFGTEAAFNGPREDNFATNFTDQAFSVGDRLVILLYVTNAGTMATAFTGTFSFNAASGATGDSFFSLNETLLFPIPISAPADTTTVTDTRTVTLVHKPQGAESLTVTDTATAQRWETFWAGDIDLFLQPQIADTLALSDGRTVIIPAENAWQFATADQLSLTDTGTVLLPFYVIAATDSATVSEAATVNAVLLIPAPAESVSLDDSATANRVIPEWYGSISLLVQPNGGDSLTLVDVPTVGNDRYAEIAWIQLEVPATSTEIDVPFGMLQSGQVTVRLKYKGSTNRIRAIVATNVCGQAGTFTINDNGTEHLITIPDGIVDEELVLDEEVAFGSGVSCNVKITKGAPQ